ERLRAAGVEVVTGMLADEARRVQAGHWSRIGRSRPFVLLKLAVSADDAIGRTGEREVAVTGEIARRHVQALRTRFDAILVGRGTIEADDPQLTCRLPGLEHRSPIRIVLDSDGRLSLDRRVFQGSPPTWILTATDEESAGPRRRLKVSHRAAGGVDLRSALGRLAGEGITRLLVEGGARVARAFLEADLVDEVILFRSSTPLGGGSVPALAGLPLAEIEASERFRRTERRMFGADRMARYERAS
ncbi:MAG TPA: RibD family protein, partial [Propylenella sp.]|nr:RibD family protein [Propylenella sp.]